MEGLEGLGHASVLGGSINPLQLYIQEGYNKKRQQAAQQQYQIKQRDALIDDLKKWNPDKVWDPFYQEINDFVQKGREQDLNMIAEGMPRNQIELHSSRWKGEANTLVSKGNGLKEIYDQLGKTIDADPEFKTAEAHSAINNHFFDGIHAKSLNNINPEDAAKSLNNSKLYDVDRVTTNFMKDLPNQINKYYTDLYEQYGKAYDITQTESKLGHEYEIVDGQRRIKVDSTTGLPKINMTDDVYIAAMQNPKLKNLVNDNVGADAPTEKKREYLTQLLKAKDPNNLQKSKQLGHATPAHVIQGQEEDAFLSDRFRALETAGIGYHPEELARVIDPKLVADKNMKVFYSNIGKGAKQETNEWNPKAEGKPPFIHMEFQKNDPLFYYGLGNLSEKDKADLIKDHAKTFEVNFDLRTEAGRRQLHEFGSGLIDGRLEAKSRLGEKYSKYVHEQYTKNTPASNLNADKRVRK